VAATVPAVVRARQYATLGARVPGAVVALPFREGERVAAGTVVARLEEASLRAGLQAAEIARSSAEADHGRTERLLAVGAATPQEMEQAASRKAAALAAVSAARERLSYAVLRAPFAGTIAARPANVGDVVTPGTPIVEIEGDGALELLATVDAAQARGLEPGARLAAEVDGHDGPLQATVVSLTRAGDPGSHRFELRAALPPATAVRSGVFGRLTLPGPAGADGVPSVPARAVFARGGLTGVFVADGSTARLRWIAAGVEERGQREVRAGLVAGERVVLEPAGLEDGAAIVVR
jgi:RND family efflux transporter MFP subunit